LILISFSFVFGLSQKQVYVVMKIKKIAREFTRYPTTIAAQSIVESSAGMFRVGDDGVSLGVLHIQVPTVRFIASVDCALSWTDKLSDYQIALKLLSDDQFSVEVASRHLNYYMDRVGYFKAVSIYNGGWNNKRYFGKVMKAKKQVNRLTKKRK